MAAVAPVNKIIPFSLVDGPGSRAAVFLQGCNIACEYCHNPETQRLCDGCGLCIEACPVGALMRDGSRVIWDEGQCLGCDACIRACERHASPKVVVMSAEEVFERIRGWVPFIRGVTASGGECTLHPAFLTRLFELCKEAGLGTLVDSNGTVGLWNHADLLDATDGVMLDVKSWSSTVFRRLTGAGNEAVKRNLELLSGLGKLEEVRVVYVDGEWTDARRAIRGVAEVLGRRRGDVRLKLIPFRPNGVRGALSGHPAPGSDEMLRLRGEAVASGFGNVVVVGVKVGVS